MAHHVAEALDRIPADTEPGARLHVEVVSEPFTTGCEDTATLFGRVRQKAEDEEWDLVVALTELPLRCDGRHIVTDVLSTQRCALVCLPALGGLLFHHRARGTLLELVHRLAGPAPAESSPDTVDQVEQLLAKPLSPIRRRPPDEDHTVDARFVLSGWRGRLRLL